MQKAEIGRKIYRATPHTTTGIAPAELLFNRKMETKLPQLEISERTEITEQRTEITEQVQKKDEWAKEKTKEHADRKS